MGSKTVERQEAESRKVVERVEDGELGRMLVTGTNYSHNTTQSGDLA